MTMYLGVALSWCHKLWIRKLASVAIAATSHSFPQTMSLEIFKAYGNWNFHEENPWFQ